MVFVASLFFAAHKAAVSFGDQIGKLMDLNKVSGLSPPMKLGIKKLLSDLLLLQAICRALAGFIFVRLVLGIFGMDLYEIYWWFAGGLAISLLKI